MLSAQTAPQVQHNRRAGITFKDPVVAFIHNYTNSSCQTIVKRLCTTIINNKKQKNTLHFTASCNNDLIVVTSCLEGEENLLGQNHLWLL